jgi:ion channel
MKGEATWFISHIVKYGVGRLLLEFILIYLGVAALCALIYMLGHRFDWADLNGICKSQMFYENYAYFSLVSQTTIGYGDIEPVGFFRIIAIAQTIFSIFFTATWLGTIVTKLLLPNLNSIIGSNKAYYCPDTNEFIILLVNTYYIEAVHVQSSFEIVINGSCITLATTSISKLDIAECRYAAFSYSWDDLFTLYSESKAKELNVSLSLFTNFAFSTYATNKTYTCNDIFIIDNISILEAPVLDQNKLTKEFWNAFNGNNLQLKLLCTELASGM